MLNWNVESYCGVYQESKQICPSVRNPRNASKRSALVVSILFKLDLCLSVCVSVHGSDYTTIADFICVKNNQFEDSLRDNRVR